MKTRKNRILASALALTAASAALSGTAVHGAMWYTTVAPTDFTVLEDNGFLSPLRLTGGGTAGEPYTVYYQKGETATDVKLLYNYRFNETKLYITDTEAFTDIYAKYQEQLDFDQYEEAISNTAEYPDVKFVATMYDNLDETGTPSKNPKDFTNKRDLMIQLCKELKEANAISDAEFTPNYAYMLNGFYDNTVLAGEIASGETEAITAIAQKYDDSVTVEAAESDTALACKYIISSVEDISAAVAIAEEIEKTYEKANAGVSCGVEEQSTAYNNTPIDLCTAHITGDITGDNKPDADDAYEALLYYAKTQTDGEAFFTDNSDKAKETAAYAAADVNADNVINADDAYLILQYYAKTAAGLTPVWD